MTTDSAPGAKVSRRDVRALEKKAFSFLTEEGFTRRKVENTGLLTEFAYVSPEWVFETSMDWRDRCVDVYVCRTVDGRIRETLFDVLLTGDENDRVAAARLREVSGYGHRHMLDELSVSASALRRSMPRILARFGSGTPR